MEHKKLTFNEVKIDRYCGLPPPSVNTPPRFGIGLLVSFIASNRQDSLFQSEFKTQCLV